MYTYKNNQIDAHIVQVERDAGKLQDKIHSLAVSTMKVWHDTPKAGRAAANVVACDRINRLQAASPYHSVSFSKWVANFLPYTWNNETSLWVENEKEVQLMGKTFVALRDMPFYKFRPATVPTAMDIFDVVDKLLSRAESRVKKPVEGDVIPSSVINKLREIAALAA